jgi:transketolase
VSYGALGSTHHSLHDLAALRAINNIDVVAPADNTEARAAIEIASKRAKPTYIRFGKAPLYDLPSSDDVEIGKARTIRAGNDVCFIATGETVIHALLAAGSLAEAGLSCRVISMHTIKPLDVDTVMRAGAECGAVITVEEHSVHGGLGEACAALLFQAGVRTRFKIVGIPDEYTVTGSQAEIFRHYGITMEGLAATALSLLK